MLHRALVGTHDGAQGRDGAAYVNAFRTCDRMLHLGVNVTTSG